MIILIIIEYTFGLFLDKLKMIMQTNLLIYYQEWKQLLVKCIFIFKTSACITKKYSKNDKLIVYKSQ